MEVSESLHRRAVTALWIEEDGGHWRSTLFPHHGEQYRLRNKGRRISQLLVLWVILNGDPVGQLSNACGRSECVNPYHYRDQSEREQLEWRSVDFVSSEALAPWIEEEENRFMQLLDIVNESSASIENAYGMTNDMGCYHCGKRFDPLVGKNKVVCPECWTDEDQSFMEGDNAD